MTWASALKKQAHGLFDEPPEFERPAIPQHAVDWSRLVCIDFETFWSDVYTLKKLSTSEYIRDPRFKAQMMGIKIGHGKTRIIPAARIKAELAKINWATHSLLCHNTQFDGFILSHHYGVHPVFLYDSLSMARGLHSNDIGAGLDEVSIYYGGAGKIEGALDETLGMRNWPKDMFARVGLYCANDVDEMFRIFKAMLPKMPDDEMRLIDMVTRMFTSPVLKVDLPRVEAELKRELDRREVLFASVLDPKLYYADKTVLKTKAERELTGKERDTLIVRRVIGSSPKFADLLRAEAIEPPVKISPAWMKLDKAKREEQMDKKYAYAFAKDDVKFVELPNQIESWGFDLNKPAQVKLMAIKQARIQNLVDCRVAVKSTTNITRAERFLKAGANGMSLPCGYAYYRAHCVPGSTEVLTQNGWQCLEKWGGGLIAQVHTDQTIEFLPASKFAGPSEKHWLKINAPYLKETFTLGHTMPFLRQKSFRWATESALEFAQMAVRDVPLAGTLKGGDGLTPDQMRVLVMVQADGSYQMNTAYGRQLTIFVKKDRKITRARALLNAAGVTFREAMFASHPGFVRFIVRFRDLPYWLTLERKFFGSWLLDSSAEAREALIDELQHWDGWNSKGGMRCYSTSCAANAEWVSTLCHLTGRCASTYVAPGIGKRVNNYTVSIRQRSRGLVRASHMEKVELPIGVDTYCATTETGFWLARSNGRIFVTGNTGRLGGNNKMNMQNLTRGGELRLSILADKGHQIAVKDSGQIEVRVTAWLWGQHDLLEEFRASDAGTDKDPYCKFGDVVYGRTITKADPTERFVAKTATLGLGYQMGAPKFQLTLAKGNGGPAVYLPLDECKRIVNSYRQKNNKIRNGWDKCKRIIEDMAAGRTGSHGPINWEKETIWLPNGMALKYPDLRQSINDEGWDEWTYQSKDQRKKIYGGLLCENIVQALARIIVMWQTLQISKKYRVVMSTHDECAAHVKTSAAKACDTFMDKCMRMPPAWCLDIPLSCEGGYAPNYSK